MKVIINLFNAFHFFKYSLAKPLYSLKPIIIFANYNPKKKDWEHALQNIWSPALIEVENALHPDSTFIKQKLFKCKPPQVRPKVTGLFELSKGKESLQRKGDFSQIKAKQFKHKIEVLNEIEDISIDDLPTVYSEYEPRKKASLVVSIAPVFPPFSEGARFLGVFHLKRLTGSVIAGICFNNYLSWV